MAIGDVRYSHFDAQKHETNKKRPERRKHCVPDAVPDRGTESATAVVKQSQNSPPAADPLPRDAEPTKFNQLEMVITCTYRPSLMKFAWGLTALSAQIGYIAP